MEPLVVVAGPTGSGKSDLAVRLATVFRGEIVNCDSVQVYRYFDIGSAKIPAADRCGISHHLLDIASPNEVFTAGDYARLARAALREIRGRGRLPIVVGGTGFYLRALLEGLFEGPARDEGMRARLAHRERRRPGSLHRLLRRWDPDAAQRIHANDVNKVIRAVEVILTSRRPVSQMHRTGRKRLEGFRALQLGLNPPREELYRRLDTRSRRLFESGLIEEARRILALGFEETVKPFESLGYAQALRVIRGEIGLEAAVAETQLRTRQYAKRQWTWFRRQASLEWVDGFGSDEAVREWAENRVRDFLYADIFRAHAG